MTTQGAARSKRRGRGLPKRQPTTSFYDVKVADDAEIEAAKAELETAQGYSLLRLSSDKDMKAKADEMLDAAQKRHKACYQRMTFRELPAKVMEAIKTAYPDPDDVADMPSTWQNPVFHALAAVSNVPDPDRTDDEWRDLFRTVTDNIAEIKAEVEEWAEWSADFSIQSWVDLMNALNRAQWRPRGEGIPKG